MKLDFRRAASWRQALVAIALDDLCDELVEKVKIREIAEHQDLPVKEVENVLQAFRRQGFVISERVPKRNFSVYSPTEKGRELAEGYRGSNAWIWALSEEDQSSLYYDGDL